MSVTPSTDAETDQASRQQAVVHTPGPWTLEMDQGQPFTAIGEPIAIVGGPETGERVRFIVGRYCDYGPHGDEQTTANAKLIALSPELLETIKRIRHFLASGCDMPLNRRLKAIELECEAAIAKVM